MRRNRSPLDIIPPKLRSTVNEPLLLTVHAESPANRLQFTGDEFLRRFQDGLVCVVRRSPLSHKRAVETLATYFRREFDYDFVQYSSDEDLDDRETVAFIWTTGYEGDLSVIGACCFRLRHEETTDFKCWALQWIWFHPYFRGKGILTRAWPLFCKAFGSFEVEHPISFAMKCFLDGKPFVTKSFPTKDGRTVSVPFYTSNNDAAHQCR